MLAQEVGLRLPVCHGPATAATAEKPLRYPVVVKPIQHDRLLSLYGTKLFLAEDAAELRTAIERLRAADVRGLVFMYVPGPDSQLYVYCVHLDQRGEPSPGITVRKLRQNPPLIGGPRVCEVADEHPALRELTVELLRRAGVRGLGYAEFKLDQRNGRFVFIEVNCRTVALDGILPPTGIDLVSKAWSELALGEPLRMQQTGWRGCWIHLQADLACSLRERLSLRAAPGPQPDGRRSSPTGRRRIPARAWRRLRSPCEARPSGEHPRPPEGCGLPPPPGRLERVGAPPLQGGTRRGGALPACSSAIRAADTASSAPC